MNISPKYDLGDIVKELGSSNSAKASKTAGSEGIFGAILSDLAAAGITGKVAAEVAEAVESGATTPLSWPANDLIAHFKAMQGEASTTARDSTLDSNSARAATGLLAELKELQDLRKGNFESDAGKVSQTRIERDAEAMGAQGLIAFLQARLESSRATAQSDAVSKFQAESTQRANEKQSNPFTSLLTNDALRITKLKDSRAVLLGPDSARKPNEGATNRVENEFASRLNQISESQVSKNDDSPEYWNRETARLLAEMGRGSGTREFIPDTPSASDKHIEASNSALTNASAFSTQLASLNSAAANSAVTSTSNATTMSRASELQSDAGSMRSHSNGQRQNRNQIAAMGIESAAVTYNQAQRPARFENIGLLGQTATESQAMSATTAQAIAQAKTEAGQANQPLSANRGEKFAVSATPINAQLTEKAQQQRKRLTSSLEAGALGSTTRSKSEANTAALKQQFSNVVLNGISATSGSGTAPSQTNPLGSAFSPVVNQAKQARDTSPLTQVAESEITLQELELGVSQATSARTNEAATERVSIANLPQGIASRINPHLARGLGSGPTKISISLFPENYGQVDVEFVYSEEAGLRISMSSENAETTRLLQSNSGGLREALLGNSLADVSVDVNTHGQSKREGSAANEQNKASIKQIAPESAKEAGPLKAKASSDNSDGLDTYV
ncbi:MAG: flagellar hook-length control protein FliK [Proteobacteria bacterium]|nr:flagellar hook-length control protein FliK [Pseudomonadota bacterium]